MKVMCEIAAPFVANSAVDDTDVVRVFRSHTSSCLRCQARYAAMVKTAREMTSLADVKIEAPPDLEWRVMASLEGDLAVARSWRTPVAVLAAAASMAVAFVMWRFRPKAN